MERKLIKSVEDFVVYQKAVKLFEDFLEEDLPYLRVGEAREDISDYIVYYQGNWQQSEFRF